MAHNRFPPAGPRGSRQDDFETQVDLATSAATTFIEEYYKAANNYRFSLAGYYVPATGAGTDKSIPTIVFNGNELADAKMLQEIFEKQTPDSHIEMETIDCHVINPNYPITESDSRGGRSNIQPFSLLVIAGGIYRIGVGKDAVEEDFCDSLILVPNLDHASSRNSRGRVRKEYLIESQTFRLVSGAAHQQPNGTLPESTMGVFAKQG